MTLPTTPCAMALDYESFHHAAAVEMSLGSTPSESDTDWSQISIAAEDASVSSFSLAAGSKTSIRLLVGEMVRRVVEKRCQAAAAKAAFDRYCTDDGSCGYSESSSAATSFRMQSLSSRSQSSDPAQVPTPLWGTFWRCDGVVCALGNGTFGRMRQDAIWEAETMEHLRIVHDP